MLQNRIKSTLHLIHNNLQMNMFVLVSPVIGQAKIKCVWDHSKLHTLLT